MGIHRPNFHLRHCGRLPAILVAAFLTCLFAAAQQPPPDLRALKSQLRHDLLTTVLPVMKGQRDELQALERKQAEAQDYAGAVRARDERIKLEGEIGAMEKELASAKARAASVAAAKAPERIEFKLGDASLTGLQIDPADQALTGFGGTPATATWTLPDLPPGGYEVMMTTTGGDGTVTLSESFYSLSATIKNPSAKPIEKNLGTLRIRDGRAKLTLSATPPEKCAALRVYALVLVPAAR